MTSAQDPDTQDSRKHLKGLTEGNSLAGNSTTITVLLLRAVVELLFGPISVQCDLPMALPVCPFRGTDGRAGSSRRQQITITHQNLVTSEGDINRHMATRLLLYK